GMAVGRRLVDQLVRVRAALEEAEIGGDLQLGVAGHGSAEETVQEPARRRLAGPVEPVAEQPEALPLGVLDPVIVAGPRIVAPPFAGDPLGPLGAAHLMGGAAP